MTIRQYPIWNKEKALNDFQSLLASKMTSFSYGDCPSECTKNQIRIIKEVIDESAVIETSKNEMKKCHWVNNGSIMYKSYYKVILLSKILSSV